MFLCYSVGATWNQAVYGHFQGTIQKVRSRMSVIRTSNEAAPLDCFIPLEASEKKKEVNWTAPKIIVTPPPGCSRNLDCDEDLNETLSSPSAEFSDEMESFRRRTAELNERIVTEQRGITAPPPPQASVEERQMAALEAAKAKEMQSQAATLLTQQIESWQAQNALHQQLIQALCSPGREQVKDRERPVLKESDRPFKRARSFEPYIEIIDDSDQVYVHTYYSPNRLAVHHLNALTTTETLLSAFREFDRIKKFTLVKGLSRSHSNIAFVEYETEGGAQRAFQSLHEVSIDGSLIGVNWSPSKFDRRSRNIKVVYNRNTTKIPTREKAALFNRESLSRRFGRCLDSYSKPGSNRVFLRFNDEKSARDAFAAFSKMGFDVHYAF